MPSRWETGADLDPLLTGPAYITTDQCGRWHRTRSGVRVTPPACFRDRAPWDAWHAWCSQSFHSTRPGFTGAATPTDDRPVCGACEGRAIGAGAGTRAVDTDGAALIYRPWRLDPPRWCPGSGAAGLPDPGDPDDWRRRKTTCVVCGEVEPIRALGGPYTPYDGLRKHEPGPGLVLGCPLHAWNALIQVVGGPHDQTVMCLCEATPGTTYRRVTSW